MVGRFGVRSVGGPVTLAAAPTLLKRTPLHSLHLALGAKMVPFAGYEMPVQYPSGILSEHLHTRSQAGLFDVSHMGQLRLAGGDPVRALEALVPGDLQALAPLSMRYTLLLNEEGGILDDLMATRLEDGLFLVVNAARKEADLAHLRARLGSATTVEPLEDRALLALQGPAAAVVLSDFCDGIAGLDFMTATETTLAGRKCLITRSGYTGEDGFEISLPAADATAVAEMLLARPEVRPIGLGARDSLRLEAGLCLYGHDIDETTSPIEAGLTLDDRQAAKSRKRVSRSGGRVAPARRGGSTYPRRHPAGWARAGTRRHTSRRHRRGEHRASDERRLRPFGRRTDRDGLCRPPPCRGRHTPRLARARHRPPGPSCAPAVCAASLSPRLMPQGENLPMSAPRFTKDHEWVRLDGDLAVVGITDYAQSQLGDVVYVELPEIGRRVEQGKEAAVVESVKAASEVYAPVSGEVAEINEMLTADPAKVNADPMGEGWFLKLRIDNPAELDGLMDQAAYQRFVEEQH